MEEFEMEPEEALREAVEQFESQGKAQDCSTDLMFTILREKQHLASSVGGFACTLFYFTRVKEQIC